MFTSWDFATSLPDEPQPSDHRPLLHEAGFAVEAYEPDRKFETLFRAMVEAYEAQRPALRDELGEEQTERMIARYQRRLTLFPGWKHVLIVARLE